MRKILTLITAILVTLPMLAIGDNSGDSKADAIDFNWEKGCEQDAGAKWYRVPLDPLYEEDNPTLALYLTNLENEEVRVVVTGYIMSEQETREYDIAAKSNQIWSRSAAALVSFKQTEIYLVLESNKRVALSAKVYETTDLDEACLKANEFKWDDQSMVQPIGQGWWSIDLTQVKAQTDKTARIVVTNMGTQKADYTIGVSPDCPSSGLTEKSASLAPGAQKEEILKRALIDMLAGQYVYVRVSTNQPLNLFAELVDKPAPTEPAIACDATELKMDVDYTQAKGEAEYRIAVAELKGKKMMPEVTLINTSNAGPAKLTAKVAFACGTDAGSTDFMEYSYTVAPGKTIVRDVEKNMVDGIKEGVEYIYIRLNSTQDIAFSARLKNVHEGNACKTSTLFDWEKGHVQNTPDQVWYAVGIKDIKKADPAKNIHLFVENNATTKATIKADLAFDCPYVDLQSITRSVEGGKTLDKVLDYSLYAAMADTIYVGITANKSVKFYAVLEDAQHTPSFPDCSTAKDFDWEYGVKQEANVAGGVLYKVDIDYLRNTDPNKVTVVTVHNLNTNAPANISGELSWECPDTKPTQKRSITLAKDGVYEKEIARDLFSGQNGLDPSIHFAYILVKSDQQIAIQIKKEDANPGAYCKSAIPFNWVSGNDQAAKDGAVWYVIDLKDAKAATGKQIRARIINKDRSKAGNLDAFLATTCPCEVPQEQGVKIAAGATREKVIARASLETFGDQIWVRLSSDVNIHFEAEIEDADPFTPITACADAQKFEFGKEYTISTDEAWFAVKTDTLQKEAALTPKAFLTSLATVDNTIKVEVAYTCPVLEAMAAKSTSLKGGASIAKLIERSMIEEVVNKYETVWFRVSRSKPGNFKFRVDLVDPNTGDKCEHAIILTTRDTTIDQKAGSTVWYRIDRKAFIDQHKRATLTLRNMDNTAGRISAAAYSACGEEPFQTASREHSAGAVKSKELGSDFFRGFSGDYIYLELTVSQKSQIVLKVEDEEPYQGDPNACEKAVDVAPNMEYAQKADTAVWYRIDLNNLRANTVGDGTLTINNKVGQEILLKGEISWECPVQYKMTEKSLKIAANGTYTRLVERATINTFEENEVFVLVTTRPGENITFRFDIQLSKGDECLNPILFDWENGHIHPAKQDLWYLIELNPTIIPEGKDIELHFENLVDAQTKVVADLFYNCRDKSFKSLDYNFKGKADSVRVIDRDLIEWIGWPNPGIYVHYSSSNNTRFWAQLIDAEPTELFHETIREFVCDGEVFHDKYAGNDHVIDSKVAPYFMWNDTIPFRKGTSLCDSIYHFHVTPIVAPDTTLDVAGLQALGALPLVARGMAVYADAAIANLKAHFDALDNDSVITVDAVEFEAKDVTGNWRDIKAVYAADYFLPDDAGAVELRYKLLVNACGEDVFYGPDLTVAPLAKKALSETVAFADTLCVGVPAQIGLNSYTIVNHADTVVTDKWQGFLAADTLGQPRYVDSTKVYNVVVWKNPDLTQVNFRVPTLNVGQTIDFTQSEADIKAALSYARGLNPSIADIKAIGWQMPIPGGYVDYDNSQPIAEGTTSLTLRYFVQTTCDEIVNNADSTWQVKETCPTIETTDPITKCAAELPFTWNGLTVTADGGPYVATLPSILNPGCDSIVTLALTINPIDTVRIIPADAATICAAALPYKWSRPEFTAPIDINEAGTHHDTLPDLANCKVTIFTLELTVNDIDTIAAGTQDVTICETELPYTWNPIPGTAITVDAEGTKYDTVPDLANCKVDIYTLNLTVNKKVVDQAEDKSICEGDSYDWKDAAGNLIKTVSAADKYEHTVYYLDEAGAPTTCVKEHYELTLSFFAGPDTIRTEDVVCEDADYEWKDAEGKVLKTFEAVDADIIDTVRVAHEGGSCLAHVYTLSLKVEKLVTYEDKVEVNVGDKFVWYGKEYIITKNEEFDKYFTDDITGCDTAHYHTVVTVLPIGRDTAEVNVQTVCPGSYVKNGAGVEVLIVADTTWVDSVRIKENKKLIDRFYPYEVYVYRELTSLPGNLLENVSAVCGQVLDVAQAEADIHNYLEEKFLTDHIDKDVKIAWAIKINGKFDEDAAAKHVFTGDEKDVEFQCTVTGQNCGSSITLTAKIEVENPQLAIVADLLHVKYGDWIIVLDVNALQDAAGKHQLQFDEADVEWYQIINGVETPMNHTGYYYTEDKEMGGEFFVLIHAETKDGCDAVIRSDVKMSRPANAPLKLIPNVVANGGMMNLINLNEEVVSDIKVFDGSGVMTWKTTSEGTQVLEIQAEGTPGIYLMQVQSGDKQETLRYIIK